MGTNGESWRSEATPLVSATPALAEAGDSHLSLLTSLTSQLALSVALPEFLADAVEYIASAVKCDSCLIYMVEGDELVLRAAKSQASTAADRVKLKVCTEEARWLAPPFRPIVISRNAHADRRFQLFNKLAKDRAAAFLSVPMLSQGRFQGLINVQTHAPHAYDVGEIRLLSAVSSLVGAKIEIEQLENEARRLAKQIETRKVVERAKGILQSSLNLSEQDAYARLQRQSQQNRKSMKEIAEAVILSHSVAHPAP